MSLVVLAIRLALFFIVTHTDRQTDKPHNDKSRSFFVMVLPTAPTAPTDVGVSREELQGQLGQALVSWKLPTSPNGVITGFTVRWQNASGTYTENVSGNTRSLRVQVRLDMEYTFSVSFNL